MRYAGLVLLLSGCSGIEVSLANDPPQMLTFNGVTPVEFFGFWVVLDESGEGLTYTPGEPFDIELEVFDPDNDGIQVWFPWAPAGLEFDPAETSGTWYVPEDAATQGELVVVLEDDSADNNGRSYYVQLFATY